MYRLLLEYGRIIDDDRNVLGYPGDGSEVDESKWAKLLKLGANLRSGLGVYNLGRVYMRVRVILYSEALVMGGHLGYP